MQDKQYGEYDNKKYYKGEEYKKDDVSSWHLVCWGFETMHAHTAVNLWQKLMFVLNCGIAGMLNENN